MNEQQSDFEWLQQFARAGDQTAFGEIVRRHLDLVYATALRKSSDAGGAQEISQNVFRVLARKAWQFGPDDSLPAWLYKTTLFESQAWLRGELRRRRREQTAAELGTTMRTPNDQPAFNALLPLLDEALLSLRERDRIVLLLRFYEKQTLRNVGGTLGVSEDAAQKRVAAALEKLSQFFQIRGYRTATVAAATAALQHTSATATAATASLVLAAALKSPPAGLAGLVALLARFAGITKVQTAAVCLAVAVASVAWKGNQIRTTRMAAAAMQGKVAALQKEQAQAANELAQLREESLRLEQKRVETVQTGARMAEAGRKLANLKAQNRALLAADDYRWPVDQPFVRVPKSALASLKVGGGPDSPQKLATKMDEFLDLTPQERDVTAQIVSNYFGQIDHLVENSLYETNRAAGISLPPLAESKVFVLPPLGEKIRTALDGLCTSLEAVLGSERWAMVRPEPFEFAHYEQVRLLGYTTAAWDRQQEVAINIFQNSPAGPTISMKGDDGTGSSPVPIRLFLSDSSPFLFNQGPPALEARIKQYCFAEAQAWLSNAAAK